MEINDFILKSLERLKTLLTNAVSDLEPDELKWRAGPQANPIGFILWHQIRTEDRFINTLFQQKPQVWEQEKWYQKMNLSGDPNDTGWGYTAEQVVAFPMPELERLLQYGEAVRTQTVEYIENLKPDDLSRIVEHPRLGQITVSDLIILLLGEIYQHIGQIAYLRGLVKSLK